MGSRERKLHFPRIKNALKIIQGMYLKFKKNSEGNFPPTRVKQRTFVLVKDTNLILQNNFFSEILKICPKKFIFRPFEDFNPFVWQN
jgi:hypothetical protein